MNAFLAQHTASLCACIVKLCRLTDDNRTGADHEYLVNIFILWHIVKTMPVEMRLHPKRASFL